jgi:hypothetical protein
VEVDQADPPILRFTLPGQSGAAKTVRYFLWLPSDIATHAIMSTLEVNDDGMWTEIGMEQVSCEVEADEWTLSAILLGELDGLCDPQTPDPLCDAHELMGDVADPNNGWTAEQRITACSDILGLIKTAATLPAPQQSDLRIRCGHLMRLWQIIRAQETI